MSKQSEIQLAEQDEEFERAWDAADWMFKNDKQDAKYFFLLGQRVEKVRQLRELEGGNNDGDET